MIISTPPVSRKLYSITIMFKYNYNNNMENCLFYSKMSNYTSNKLMSSIHPVIKTSLKKKKKLLILKSSWKMKLFLTFLSMNMSNLGLKPVINDWKICKVPIEDRWRETNRKGTMLIENYRMDGNWTYTSKNDGRTTDVSTNTTVEAVMEGPPWSLPPPPQ